jgi:hypothetical protein
MEKTKICNYWKNKTCKYMNEPLLCSFAHGHNDITPIPCIYKNKCCNNNCNFDHGNIRGYNSKIEINLYDLINKRKQKNKKKVKINKEQNINNYDNNFNTDNNDIISNTITCDNIKSVKIIKKDVLEKNIIIKIGENTELNKLLNHIDEYYIKRIININSILDKKTNELEEYIKKYNDLEKSLDLKNNINIQDVCDNTRDNKNEDDFVINKKYIKYYNLGKILKENNNVDNNLILSYFNNKNLSMVKNRCNRIFKIINYMKNNNIKYIKSSIRNIFHMKKEIFISNLYNNTFFD